MTHNYKQASMVRRVIAFLIDGILMGGLVCCFLFVYMGKPEIAPNADEGKISIADQYQFFSYAEPIALSSNRGLWIEKFVKNYPLGAAMIFLLPLLYGAIFEGMDGATIGKYLTGIRVRRKDLGKISFGNAFMRNIGKVISKLILFLGFLIAFFDKKSQTLHDKFANTIVVNK